MKNEGPRITRNEKKGPRCGLYDAAMGVLLECDNFIGLIFLFFLFLG